MFGAGDYAKALELLTRVDVTPENQAEIEAARQELSTLIDSRMRSITYLTDHGEWLRAKEAAGALAKCVAGIEVYEQQVEGLMARFETQDGKRELDFDKKLETLWSALGKRGMKEGSGRSLERLAKNAEGTKVGARAKELAEIVTMARQH